MMDTASHWAACASALHEFVDVPYAAAAIGGGPAGGVISFGLVMSPGVSPSHRGFATLALADRMLECVLDHMPADDRPEIEKVHQLIIDQARRINPGAITDMGGEQ